MKLVRSGENRLRGTRAMQAPFRVITRLLSRKPGNSVLAGHEHSLQGQTVWKHGAIGFLVA